ncbi:hypothetical protein R8Z50_26680 [Longispora sp. K20-0274]|uniref:hypothetical protein n=1 Tax=Longispora sp. K20-0274 TaxID=3088255 RepID=UPI00399A96B8
MRKDTESRPTVPGTRKRKPTWGDADAATANGAAYPPADRDGTVTPDGLIAERAAVDERPDPEADGPVPAGPAAVGSAKVPPAPPGAVEPLPTPVQPDRRLWTAGTSEGMHERWQALQLRFVDDPRSVAGEARTLVDEAVRTLSAELADRQRELDAWDTGTDPDTERLRLAVQQYRDFFTFLLTR